MSEEQDSIEELETELDAREKGNSPPEKIDLTGDEDEAASVSSWQSTELGAVSKIIYERSGSSDRSWPSATGSPSKDNAHPSTRGGIFSNTPAEVGRRPRKSSPKTNIEPEDNNNGNRIEPTGLRRSGRKRHPAYHFNLDMYQQFMDKRNAKLRRNKNVCEQEILNIFFFLDKK